MSIWLVQQMEAVGFCLGLRLLYTSYLIIQTDAATGVRAMATQLELKESKVNIILSEHKCSLFT